VNLECTGGLGNIKKEDLLGNEDEEGSDMKSKGSNSRIKGGKKKEK